MAKILAVSHDSTLYGAQRSLLDVVIGLKAAGHQVEVCVPSGGALADLLHIHGINVHILQFKRWIPSSNQNSFAYWIRLIGKLPFNLFRILNLIKSGRYDLVYTNTVTVIDFAFASKLLGIPHIWHLRESAAKNPQLRSLLPNKTVISIVQFLSVRVIYNSYYLLNRYKDKKTESDIVVHNGLSGDLIQKVWALNPACIPVFIATVGYMEHRKGLDVLLDAIALMPVELQKSIVLRVAGHIEHEYMTKEISHRIEQLSCRVELLGWVEDVADLLTRSDILVSSARDEPFGRTLLEAMIVGIPVIATRSGGPEEIIVDLVTGLLVPSDDPARLADALVQLLNNPSRRQALGNAGHDRAVSVFSLQSYIQGIEQCLIQALSQ